MNLSGFLDLFNNRLLRRFDARLVRSSWLETLAQHAGARPGGAVLSGGDQEIYPGLPDEQQVRKISSLTELDEILVAVEAARLVSDDAMLAAFKTFEFQPPPQELPDDPFSKEYSDYQYALYAAISGKDYQVKNEATNWLVPEEHALRPYPYYTGSYQIVSDQLIMIGLIIRTLQLPPGASILELGAGYGNTSLALAQTGYQVTVIDIEQRFLDIISARCAGPKNPPKTICADFTELGKLQDRFDAILFYGCFHHCSDHQLLASFFSERLNSGGQVMFASEPITDAFSMPWGLRLDGQSLWAIRHNGWLELGFTEKYFAELMSRNGLSLQRFDFPITELGTIFVAR